MPTFSFFQHFSLPSAAFSAKTKTNGKKVRIVITIDDKQVAMDHQYETGRRRREFITIEALTKCLQVLMNQEAEMSRGMDNELATLRETIRRYKHVTVHRKKTNN